MLSPCPDTRDTKASSESPAPPPRAVVPSLGIVPAPSARRGHWALSLGHFNANLLSPERGAQQTLRTGWDAVRLLGSVRGSLAGY